MKTIGISLSGGAVRGLAHIGVLKVLEEYGVPVHVVAGTSAGALAGAFFAAGLPARKIETVARTLDWGKVSALSFGGMGVLDAKAMEHLIERTLGPLRVQDLPRKFAAMAVSLTTGRLEAFTEGPLARAVRASTAIPGVFKPVEIDGELYVDGGVRSFDPVEQVRRMGADFCIAVKLIPPAEQQIVPRNIVQVVLAAFDLNTHHIATLEPSGDVTITPDLTGTSSFEFRHRDLLIRRGEEAARKVIPEILRRLQRRTLVERARDALWARER
ncbi:MAG: patatin-like phospholipase family protein [Spirochaetota bacterium]